MTKLAFDLNLSSTNRRIGTRWLAVLAPPIALAAVSLALPIASPFVNLASAELTIALGVGGVVLHTLLLMGSLLWLLRHEQLPTGGVTFIITLHTLILGLFSGAMWFLPLFMISAAAGDVLLYHARRVRLSPPSVARFATLLPMLLFGSYFALVYAFGRLWWPAPLLFTTIGLAGLCGLMLARLAFPPTVGGSK